ncbi:MAG: HlyD family efflux transporter periplasmic adaptor subunit [Phycisphaeraceae bacterium]|nr:HlyD family efflux transporter periplasmic adaptor subunit [Phycisphaeraceae bacterium]MCB9847057.1 HlyD family efflux transporter periplasmic adaptor subunit [Phycisphaeraceae bacterium]
MTDNPPIQTPDAEAGGDGFLSRLVRSRCVDGSAEAGVVFRIRLTTVGGDEGSQPLEGDADILAIHPAMASDSEVPEWVRFAARASSHRIIEGEHAPSAVAMNASADDDEESVAQWIVTVPLRFGVGAAPSAVAAFLVSASRDSIDGVMGRLGSVAREFEAHERAHSVQPRTAVERMNNAVAPLLAANAQERFFGAAVAACNELETVLGASRVSVGFLRGRDIRLGAVSHTERIVRSMRLVRDIENAMEECLDQDREVVTPAPAGSRAVDRAANELARAHGPSSVCVLPLRRGGEVVGAVCVERGAESPLNEAEIESARLACELVAPRLHELFERDRWVGARAAASVRKSASSWLGPTHTWAKLGAIAGFALLAFLVIAKGPDRVPAPFSLHTAEWRVAPAPFDGYLLSVSAEVGDRVRAGALLAALDASGLLLERAEAQASLDGVRAEADRSRGAGKAAEALIAEARARELEASVALLTWRIERATITAPIDGVVVQGELNAIVGAPVRAGDTLFVVAPIDALRAECVVDASRIADVEVGASGTLATTAEPSRRVSFVVTRIDPIALDEERGGGFRVVAELESAPGWLRPGMEGVAKIDAGRARYAALWTRRLVDWVRMRLWI